MDKRMLWLCALALLCALRSTEGSNAGLKARVTVKGVEYVRQISMNLLESHLNTMDIPDHTGEYRISFLGTAAYTLSGIRIQEIHFPDSAVSFIPGTGILLSISNANISITGKWSLNIWFRSDSGTFDLSVTDLCISTILGVTGNTTGRPSVRNDGCRSSIGALSTVIYGGWSWLYNMFKGSLDQPLRDMLISNLCPQVGKAIEDLQSALSTMQVSAQIDEYAGIDYSLVDAPLIMDQFIEADFMGEFYSVGHRSEPPFSPAPFSIPDKNSQMLYFGISEFFANSAGFVYFKSGILHINITDSMIPPESPIHLKTDSFQGLIPEVAKRYPNMLVMLQVSARKQPVLTCLPGILDLAAYGSILASAILPDSTLAPLFELNLDAIVMGEVFSSGSKLSASLDLDSFSLSLVHSDVGSFKVESLQTMLTGLLQMVVLPKVNEKLSEGFPLPTIEKLTFVKPVVRVQKGYMLVSTNVHYSV